MDSVEVGGENDGSGFPGETNNFRKENVFSTSSFCVFGVSSAVFSTLSFGGSSAVFSTLPFCAFRGSRKTSLKSTW